jgi:hypothetical protein
VNKQTEPVDVLAVMGHAIESAGKMVKASNGDFRAVIYQDDLFKARAAIAELIEACQVYDDLRDRLFLLMMADPRRESLLKQVEEADKRRRAALALVGSAA